tara:strand:- start:134 stop:385 length:252 start_codon:yes stop_codon:yes gene_type:complete
MSRYNTRKWVIITLADYNDSQLNTLIANAIQTSSATLRKTLDGKKAILKWDGDTPSVFDGMDTYTHSEILTELAKSTWTEPDE